MAFKAKACERKNRRKRSHSGQDLCRICGRPTDNGGHVCGRCKALAGWEPEVKAGKKVIPPAGASESN